MSDKTILILQLVVLTLQLVGLVVAVTIYGRQAEEASKSRHLDATRLLLEQIGPDDVREIRSWLLDESPDLTTPDKEKDRKVRRLVVAYDRVGLMVMQGLLLDRALFGFQHEEIDTIWKKSLPVIKRAREKRPNYANNFQDLALKWLPKARQEDRFQNS